MKYFLTFVITLLPLISSAQSTKLLEIDVSSFAPVQTDVMSGVAIDKIGTDPSRRPCARIKMHINRMSKGEIEGLSVRTVGGSVVVTKCAVTSQGNGLIIELTAKETTRFYLHHDKYGDSNEVSLNLEGNKEYRIEASLNTTYSIVVLSNVSEAEVYLDGEYKGVTDKGNSLTVKDVYPGRHSIKVTRGSFANEIYVEVNSDNVFFRLNLETGQLKRHIVTFKIEQSGVQLKIDGQVYAEDISQDIAASLLDGEHSYSVSADMYHTEEGTIVLDGFNIEKNIRLKPAYGWLQVNDKGDLKGASVYVDGKLVGKAPVKTDMLASGSHVVRIEQNMYKSFEKNVTIRDLQTLDLSPVLEPKFANVVLRSVSNDGDIYINKEYKGPSPWSGRLTFESYEFEVRKMNHRSNSIVREITAQSEGVQISIPAPSPILGKLEIESQPSGSRVYVDGQNVGISPISYAPIIGKHIVVLEKDGFKTQEKVVEVKENEVSVVKATLEEGAEAVSLSVNGTSNCYIVSQSETYSFPTVKGNSSEPVGEVVSAVVLWESFGTSVVPNVGDLIRFVSYKDGNIAFRIADPFKEGNALIAAKDAYGTILWSWHIWLTDQPQAQVYYNNAGTMMDRNLGATSATPGDVGALGLLYQWGRKDPFLGAPSISSQIDVASSTVAWPSAVESNSSFGTIAYATANPTTFIGYNDSNDDWYYTGSEVTDDTRWTTSESNKSIYDPCPVGWRVPDGGRFGVWSKAKGSLSCYFDHSYNSTKEGMKFSGQFGRASTIWYPASGLRICADGSLISAGDYGYYWSASPDGKGAYHLSFSSDGRVYPSFGEYRACGLSVRCLQVID